MSEISKAQQSAQLNSLQRADRFVKGIRLACSYVLGYICNIVFFQARGTLCPREGHVNTLEEGRDRGFLLSHTEVIPYVSS